MYYSFASAALLIIVMLPALRKKRETVFVADTKHALRHIWIRKSWLGLIPWSCNTVSK